MLFQIKKLISIFTLNFSLLMLLLIGIQNSNNKHKVNFLSNETIELPLSFIIGLSFISGSIFGNFLPKNNFFKKKS